MRKYFVCRSSTESQVIWKKDTLTLKKGTGQSFRKKDTEIRVMVDTFSTLYLMGNNIAHSSYFNNFYKITILDAFI